jgi:hypothetical protein
MTILKAVSLIKAKIIKRFHKHQYDNTWYCATREEAYKFGYSKFPNWTFVAKRYCLICGRPEYKIRY